MTPGRHLRSFALQMLILVSMVLMITVNEDLYVALVAITILLLPPINWTVAGVLLWTSRQDPSIRSLADAADNALTWALNSTAAAIVGAIVLARLLGIIVTPVGPLLTVMLGYIVTTSSLPAFRFLQTWREIWLPMVTFPGENKEPPNA